MAVEVMVVTAVEVVLAVKMSSTTTASGPAAEPTEPVTPVEPEPQPVVPEEGLPKTGEDQMNVPMTATYSRNDGSSL